MYTVIMKKITSVYLIFLLLALCGCESESSNTRFLMDTVVNLTADCDEETLDGAFLLCEKFDKQLSRTNEQSDVYRINSVDGFTEVSVQTIEIINRAIYYSELSKGRFDITVCPVSELWDFKNQVIPEKNEIAEALKNVDYESLTVEADRVNSNGKKIDLGAIAKGYAADKVTEYLKENGAKRGIVNLGGNVVVFGREYRVGIMRPFGEDAIAVLCIKDKSAVTSGIYQRYIKDGERLYHHIIDPETGYGVENSLASVTVVGESSFDCDALSTVCMLLGKEEGLELIDSIPDTEAVFIEKNEKITLSSGLKMQKNEIYFK